MALRQFTGAEGAGTGAVGSAVMEPHATYSNVEGYATTKYTGDRSWRLVYAGGAAVTRQINFESIGEANQVYFHGRLYLISNPGSDHRLLRIELDPVGGASGSAIELFLTSARNLKVGATTGSTALSLNTWYVIEVKLESSGAWEVRINGTTEISGSPASGFGAAGTIVYVGTTTTAAHELLWDDLGIDDATWLNDLRILRLVPNGAGASTQWTPIGAAANWDCLDEVPPDDDTTYIKEATIGDKDFWTLTDWSPPDAGYAIKAVRSVYRAKRSLAGAPQFRMRMRSGATETDDGAAMASSAYERFRGTQRATDPNTGAPWSKGGLDALQIGAEKIADTDEVRISTAYLHVAYAVQASITRGFVLPVEMIGRPARGFVLPIERVGVPARGFRIPVEIIGLAREIDVTFAWHYALRTVQSHAPLVEGQVVAKPPDFAAYDLEIYRADQGTGPWTLVRTITQTGESYTYTIANSKADNGGAFSYWLRPILRIRHTDGRRSEPIEGVFAVVKYG